MRFLDFYEDNVVAEYNDNQVKELSSEHFTLDHQNDDNVIGYSHDTLSNTHNYSIISEQSAIEKKRELTANSSEVLNQVENYNITANSTINTSCSKESKYSVVFASIAQASMILGTIMISKKYGDTHTVESGLFKGMKTIKTITNAMQFGILAGSPQVNESIEDDVGKNTSFHHTTAHWLLIGTYYLVRILYAKMKNRINIATANTGNIMTENAPIGVIEFS